MDSAKPFEISKRAVYDAYLQVKSNQGAAGVDRESIQDFEKDLKNNLYKLWNRLSSGSYFPPAVLAVSIPKSNGGTRLLGIPTVADRIAQAVAKQYLEPLAEPYFHPDSYGYRPGKSALDAIGVTRRRCWRYNWVVDLDIKGFFDNLDHKLVMRAVEKHTNCEWILLYVERWLTAPLQTNDGNVEARSKGTPQGGVISPLLANMLMHYVFDDWMKREHPNMPFARYADDVVVHCRTERQAHFIKDKIGQRLNRCKLELHPDKTRIVYCKDELRTHTYQHTSFDFLGYTFRPRTNRTRHGRLFVNFSPAISAKAKKAICRRIRQWKIHLWSGATLASIAREINPVIRGWIQYYGRFMHSEVRSAVQNIDAYLIRWAMGKYKRLRGRKRRASAWLQRIRHERRNLFVHWTAGFSRWAE